MAEDEQVVLPVGCDENNERERALAQVLRMPQCGAGCYEHEAAAIAADTWEAPAQRLPEYFSPDVVDAILSELLRQQESSGAEQDGDDDDVIDGGSSSNSDDDSIEDDGDGGLLNLHHLRDSDHDSEDDELLMQPGDCELCERSQVKLTLHHLIPKSTWARLEAPLVRMMKETMETTASTNHQQRMMEDDDNHGLEHLRPALCSMLAMMTAQQQQKIGSRAVARRVLQDQTTQICRPCHSAVHRTHDNRTLAWHYNTVDKLVACPSIAKFAQWNSRQKVVGATVGQKRRKPKK